MTRLHLVTGEQTDNPEPTIYADEPAATVWHGDCVEVLTLLDADSFDAVVTDPPYGLEFMGRAWDRFEPLDFEAWCESWARQAFRVLKPGGHLLAFGGSRTWHRLMAGIEDAGFELRDSIAWLYGSGFPKSRNVTEAMDAYLAAGGHELSHELYIRPGVYDVTRFLKAARDAAGWSNGQLDALFGTNGMAGHWTSQASQPSVPSVRQWAELKAALGFDDSMDELVAELAATEHDEMWGTRGADGGSFLGALKNNPDAEAAGGWGSALKPAFEPIVVARRPFVGSLDRNVRRYGTGALNIDATRVPMSTADAEAINNMSGFGVEGYTRGKTEDTFMQGTSTATEALAHPGGRWPTNVVLDEHAAAELDRQAPSAGAAAPASGPTRVQPTDATVAYGARAGDDSPPAFYGDRGGASRFFPTFRYEPKAPTRERPAIIDEQGTTVMHPTVKPLDLMRWLIRLVVPPGGVILEPFAGSGTTVEAAILEQVRCVAVELGAEHLPLIAERLDRQPTIVAGRMERGEHVAPEGSLW